MGALDHILSVCWIEPQAERTDRKCTGTIQVQEQDVRMLFYLNRGEEVWLDEGEQCDWRVSCILEWSE